MITITIGAGYRFPAGIPITLAALRKATSGLTLQVSGAITGSDLAPATISPEQVKQGAWWYADSSTYNSGTKVYSAVFNPAPVALEPGLRLSFRVQNVNGSAPKFSPNGLPEKPLLWANHVAPQAGVFPINSVAEVRYAPAANSGTGAWLLFGTEGQVPAPMPQTAGTSGAYTLSVPAFSSASLLDGKVVTFKLHAANAVNPTLAINGNGPFPLKLPGATAVPANIWRTGEVLSVVVENTDEYYYVLAPIPIDSFSGVATGTANTYAVTLPNFPAAYREGLKVRVKIPATNTGNSTLAVTPAGGTALSAHEIQKWASLTAMDGGELINGEWVELIHTGAAWRLLHPDPARSTTAIDLPLGSTLIQTWAHGGANAPRWMRGVLRLKAGETDNGYTDADEIDLANVYQEATVQAFTLSANSTHITLAGYMDNTRDLIARHKTTAAEFELTESKWQVKVYYSHH